MVGELELHFGAGMTAGVDLNHGMVALEKGVDLALRGERLAADEDQVLLAGATDGAIHLAEVNVVVLAMVEIVDHVTGRRGRAALGRGVRPEPVGTSAAGQLVAA